MSERDLKLKLEAAELRAAELEFQNKRLRGKIESLENTIEALRSTSRAAAPNRASVSGKHHSRHASTFISKGVQLFESLIQKASAGEAPVPAPRGRFRTASGVDMKPPTQFLRAASEPGVAAELGSLREELGDDEEVEEEEVVEREPEVVPKEEVVEEAEEVVEEEPKPEPEPEPEREPEPEAAAESSLAAPSPKPRRPSVLSAKLSDVGGETTALLEAPRKSLQRRVSDVAYREQLEELVAGMELSDSDEEDGDGVFEEEVVEEEVEQAAEEELQEEQHDQEEQQPDSPTPSAEKEEIMRIAGELKAAQERLPVLVGFLQKRSPSGLKLWQSRYVAVYDYTLYYSKKPILPDDVENASDERAKSAPIHQLALVVVNKIEGKHGSQTDFAIHARDPKTGNLRKYKFRAPTSREQAFWVSGLNDHRNHLLSMLRFVSMSKSAKVEWN